MKSILRKLKKKQKASKHEKSFDTQDDMDVTYLLEPVSMTAEKDQVFDNLPLTMAGGSSEIDVFCVISESEIGRSAPEMAAAAEDFNKACGETDDGLVYKFLKLEAAEHLRSSVSEDDTETTCLLDPVPMTAKKVEFHDILSLTEASGACETSEVATSTSLKMVAAANDYNEGFDSGLAYKSELSSTKFCVTSKTENSSCDNTVSNSALLADSGDEFSVIEKPSFDSKFNAHVLFSEYNKLSSYKTVCLNGSSRCIKRDLRFPGSAESSSGEKDLFKNASQESTAIEQHKTASIGKEPEQKMLVDKKFFQELKCLKENADLFIYQQQKSDEELAELKKKVAFLENELNETVHRLMDLATEVDQLRRDCGKGKEGLWACYNENSLVAVKIKENIRRFSRPAENEAKCEVETQVDSLEEREMTDEKGAEMNEARSTKKNIGKESEDKWDQFEEPLSLDIVTKRRALQD